MRSQPLAEFTPGRLDDRVAPFVASVVGYRTVGFPPGVHVGLPSPALTMIVSLGDPVHVSSPRPGGAPGRFTALAGGLHDAPALVRHDGNQFGIHLELTPAGSRALLGVPAAALAGRVVSLSDLLGERTDELVARVAAARTWEDRFAALSAVLARSAGARSLAVAAEVAVAWDLLVGSRGRVRVDEVAREVGWSRRHLSARFSAEFGLPPKAVARIARFDRARQLLTATPGRQIATVAADCGYADQAHLTRDWRQLAGSAPRRWLADEVFPFVQDDAAAQVPVSPR